MKWFQHNSDSYTNLKMQEIFEEFGIVGYGIFWLSCEIVAQQGINYQIDNSKNWKKAITNISKTPIDTLERILSKCADLNLIDKKAFEKNCLFIPKMAEYSDDYTNKVRRKSKQYPDTVQTMSGKIRLDKIRLDKNTKNKQSSEQGSRINEKVELFKPLNPLIYKKWFANKTQRAAIGRLLEVLGDKLEIAIEAAIVANEKPYAPTITTPLQLEEKLVALRAFIAKEKNNSKWHILS